MLGFTKIALLRCWTVDRWQMTSTVSSFRRSKRSTSRAASAVLQCLQSRKSKQKQQKNGLNFKDWQYQWMKLNGIEWHTWHIRGIYVAYLPWKHLDVIWNRHFAPRVSQNGLDQSTPLTSRPLLKQQNQRRTYFRTYMMTFKSGRLLMIINDSQDAPCCSIKNDQNIYICR